MDNDFSKILKTYNKLNESFANVPLSKAQRAENRALWDKVNRKGVVAGIDRERYTDLSHEGLEGPFRKKNGEILYYDPKEGKYYNRDKDMYVDYNLDEESKFGGYATANMNAVQSKKHLVGSCEEGVDSLEESLQSKWKQFKEAKEEYKMQKWQKKKDLGHLLNPNKGNKEKKVKEGNIVPGVQPGPGQASVAAQPNATPNAAPNASAPNPQAANQIKAGLQNMKSKVPGLDVNQASQALTTADANKPMDAQGQGAVANALGKPLADIAKNPQLAGQLSQLMAKAGQQTGGAQ